MLLARTAAALKLLATRLSASKNADGGHDQEDGEREPG
jgi:hypothetical protein